MSAGVFRTARVVEFGASTQTLDRTLQRPALATISFGAYTRTGLGANAVRFVATILVLVGVLVLVAAAPPQPPRQRRSTSGATQAGADHIDREPLFARIQLVDQLILEQLRTLPSPVETYAENLDIIRFGEERSRQLFTDYLSSKDRRYPPDLIILVFVGRLGSTAAVLEKLFPRSRILVAGFEENVDPSQFGPMVSGFAQRLNPQATPELIARIHPDLRRIIAVGGTAEVDRQAMQRVAAAARRLDVMQTSHSGAA